MRTSAACWPRWPPRPLFLACYVVYHANVGSRPFGGQGAVRLVYFTILVTHVVLAALVVPLALVTASAGCDGA